MIYTVTLNPSLDYIVHLDKLFQGKTNRTLNEEYQIGGKGINVSKMLSVLKIQNTALGFAAGFTGEKILNELKGDKINADFIKLKNGVSRINVKILADTETEINANGANPDFEEFELLFEKLSSIRSKDTLVLAGSAPRSAGKDIYSKLLSKVADKNIKIVVDAEKELLLDTLKYKPFLIKPNRQELCQIFDIEINGLKDIEKHAKKLRDMGAENVLVSLGKDGALLVDKYDNVLRQSAPSGKAVNTVGAGDSMVAGFLAGYELKGDFSYALKLGTACGTAAAFSSGTPDIDKIKDIFSRLGE